MTAKNIQKQNWKVHLDLIKTISLIKKTRSRDTSETILHNIKLNISTSLSNQQFFVSYYQDLKMGKAKTLRIKVQNSYEL